MTDHSAPTRGEVTQGDREAAVLYGKYRLFSGGLSDRIAAGELDGNDLVQAFAAHRLAAIEECAKTCDHIATVADGAENIGAQAGAMLSAKAIRNLGRGV